MNDYNKENIPLAKTLRKNMTPLERKLKYDFLRNYPVRFQRQKAIGNYIVDFYCARARLVIELDGGGHYTMEQTGKYEMSTKDSEPMNLTVVRICSQSRRAGGFISYSPNVCKELMPNCYSRENNTSLRSLTKFAIRALILITFLPQPERINQSSRVYDP